MPMRPKAPSQPLMAPRSTIARSRSTKPVPVSRVGMVDAGSTERQERSRSTMLQGGSCLSTGMGQRPPCRRRGMSVYGYGKAWDTGKGAQVIKHVALDMDGVLYRGDQPLPGAIETLNALRQGGVKVAFITNNASRHREELAAKVSSLGFACDMHEIWG